MQQRLTLPEIPQFRCMMVDIPVILRPCPSSLGYSGGSKHVGLRSHGRYLDVRSLQSTAYMTLYEALRAAYEHLKTANPHKPF